MPGKRIDITGQRYGRLVAVRFIEARGKSVSYWLFDCDCGGSTIARMSAVRFGTTISCGCYIREYLNSEAHRLNSTKHGMCRTKEFRAWCKAKERCFNPNTKRFLDYGGRGITMCDEWKASFEAFYEYMGPCPKGYTLDRIDVDGNYEPGNVRWTSYTVQEQNKRSTRLSPEMVREIRQSPLKIEAMAKKLGISRSSVSNVRNRISWKNIA